MHLDSILLVRCYSWAQAVGCRALANVAGHPDCAALAISHGGIAVVDTAFQMDNTDVKRFAIGAIGILCTADTVQGYVYPAFRLRTCQGLFLVFCQHARYESHGECTLVLLSYASHWYDPRFALPRRILSAGWLERILSFMAAHMNPVDYQFRCCRSLHRISGTPVGLAALKADRYEWVLNHC